MIAKIDQNNEEEPEKIPKSVYVIAQEIKIVKSLACNDLKLREKQLRKLKKWLSLRARSTFAFTDEDFLRIWKGLFYCMWMSDKPLVQENLADELGSLLDCFSNSKISAQFFSAFLQTMNLEWFGIDQWRIDKFMMLVRRMLRRMFFILNNDKWSKTSIEAFNDELSSTFFKWKTTSGLPMHLLDIYLEELAKVSNGKISPDSVAILIKPFVPYLARQNDNKFIGHIRKNIFYQLLWQTDMGREHTEKFNAWRDMGFPTEDINDLEKVEDISDQDEEGNDTEMKEEIEDDTTTEKSLDPRAGRVDVYMPELPVNVDPIIKNLEDIEFDEITNTKSRSVIRDIISKYKKFQEGEFPMGVKKVPKLNLEPMGNLIHKTVDNLHKLEDELYSTTRKLKKLNKKKRKRLLANINLDDMNVNEDNFEEIIEKSLPCKKPRQMSADWKEEDIEIKETAKAKKSDKKKKLKSKIIDKVEKIKKLKKKTKKLVTKDEQFSENTNSTELISSNKENVKVTESKNSNSAWEKPLEDGEIEYFQPSRKIKLKKINKDFEKSANTSLVLNPFAKKLKIKTKSKNILLGKSVKKQKKIHENLSTSQSVSTRKKVKIVLHKNISQKPSEYIKQVRSSPQVPFDSDKKPTKSLLKPNLMPSPINPFYKKKIGLKFNDSI